MFLTFDYDIRTIDIVSFATQTVTIQLIFGLLIATY